MVDPEKKPTPPAQDILKKPKPLKKMKEDRLAAALRLNLRKRKKVKKSPISS
jgi:hypothetical protein